MSTDINDMEFIATVVRVQCVGENYYHILVRDGRLFYDPKRIRVHCYDEEVDEINSLKPGDRVVISFVLREEEIRFNDVDRPYTALMVDEQDWRKYEPRD